jgi:hypothetical protein
VGLRWESVFIFDGHLENFMDIGGYFMTNWYILLSFGAFFSVLVSCTDENLATLIPTLRAVKFPHPTGNRSFFDKCGRSSGQARP